jgi:ABC-type siderophore export system fused ATPase/permease subunit
MKSTEHWGADDDFLDSRAFIAKEFVQLDEVGEVSITLSSKDTYIPVGEYIFDCKA